MHPTGTYTGRSRRRATNSWVKAGDRMARLLITLGGIGTIVAVLLVGVFLLAVTLPLFRSARIGLDHAVAVAHEPGDAACLGVDDSGTVAWLGDPRGIRVFATVDGVPLLERAASECGLEGATVIRTVPGSPLAAAGFADGSFRTGRLGIESTFLAAADLPPELGAFGRGSARAWKDGVIVHNVHGQYARLHLVTELSHAASTGRGAPVIDVDVTPLAGGVLVAALDSAGSRTRSSPFRRERRSSRPPTATRSRRPGSCACRSGATSCSSSPPEATRGGTTSAPSNRHA
ncbi:MAG: hypothetical protein EBZ59_02100 [Planctomycetia bacterium]|nr:hypothetical protein [Planctomycetia bacterium]